MTQKIIFDHMDDLILNKLMQVNLGLGDIADFLKEKNISLNTKTRQPLSGENPDEIQVGDVLIRIALSLQTFLKEYKEIKDTWCVTPPSPVLDDEK